MYLLGNKTAFLFSEGGGGNFIWASTSIRVILGYLGFKRNIMGQSNQTLQLAVIVFN